ncbi:period circadian protein homolog 2 isoform X4 [Etheostoma cragini]|uniref:period circadian protein homolog 2 isoform X4 n=1 Tax=Etheostoma cragini TaxID=417921 RepID=UPI00155E2880|nr:period circadian protein homolog 2 isoform X4 [Etheostoma cragini]
MSEDSASTSHPFSVLEDQKGVSCSSMPRVASRCSAMAQLHRMGGYSQSGPDLGLPSEGSDSSGQDPPASPPKHRKPARTRPLPDEDVEMKSSGSSGSGTDSQDNESHGNKSNGNESHGHSSTSSSNGTSKDSALLESSGSNKSSNSHSPSPPSSSNAFSLLSSEQDNPSTSGCSSQESAKAKTQKEMIKTMKELKLYLPAEKRHNSKSSTLNTLKYALRCVKQVEANDEYYQLLMTNHSQPSVLDVSSYTIEEIDSITSEYTLKNNVFFAVAVSLITGRIVYISDQAASILNCKREVFKKSKFVEFIMPQDVSVFYSFTTPYRLPSWSMCTGAEASPSDCMQEKSFFCRISGSNKCEGNLQYYPFRMTPYRMKVQDTVHAEDQFCCLLLAEIVHSGYEAPRIPTDKRIFTTTHTPSCLLQDVDERAVPLLGYLPQDLIGTPFLLHLHPNDRPIMLAIHRKILKFAGQPFDHSSVRFCAQNGEYVVLETSWSSFVNPWSHKVSFVIGRHKVCTGPVNEDVFAAPVSAVQEMKTMDSDIQDITEQIHRLLLQPVRYSGSSGYSSVNRNEHPVGMSSSSESLKSGSGNKIQQEEEEVSAKARPRSFQEICKGIHLQKSQEQQTTRPDIKKSNGIESVHKSSAVVRPKHSAAPLNWKETEAIMEESRSSSQEETAFNDPTVYSYQQISCLDSVVRYLEGCKVPITMKRKCQSSSNTTSSISDEDQQRGPNSMQVSEDIIGDVQGTGETVESSHNPGAPLSVVSPPVQEREPYKKKLGLTKQVLAAHTQKEEKTFLYRFREHQGLTALKENCSQYLESQREQIASDAVPAARPHKEGGPRVLPTSRRDARNKRTKSKRAKQMESSENTMSHHRQHLQPPLLNLGLNPTSWSRSDTSQSASPMAYPSVVPGYPLQVYPGANSLPPHTDATLQGFGHNQGIQSPPCPPSIHPAPYTTPMVTPIVALMLPMAYPTIAPGLPPPQPVYHTVTGGFPTQLPPFGQAASPGQGPFTEPPSFSVQNQFPTQNPFPLQTGSLTPSFYFPPSLETSKVPVVEGQSRSTSPQSGGDGGQASPPLFQSRCSSPLNMLALDLSVEQQDSTVLSSGQGNNAAEREKRTSGNQVKERELKQVNKGNSHGDGNNSDTNSLSSGVLDIIPDEDSYSGTGSATSGSMGSGSNGFRTSASGTSNSGTSKSKTSASGTSGSGKGSNNSSKYFGSVDSSQNSQKVNDHLSVSEGQAVAMDQSEHFINDIQRVLQEDREKLWLLQKNQPHFSEEQKMELVEVYPWFKKGGLPKAIDIKTCSCCAGVSELAAAEEVAAAAAAKDQPDQDIGDTEMGEVSCQGRPRKEPSNTLLIQPAGQQTSQDFQ